jgi:DNA-binding beta-propeller fold protein YncE
LDDEGIEAVEGGDRALEASDADPAQVAFSPDGSMVIITQRGTDSIVTYEVTAEGTFGASSEVASEGPTPYGFAFTSGGTLVVAEAFGAQRRVPLPHRRTLWSKGRSWRAAPRWATAEARSAGRS